MELKRAFVFASLLTWLILFASLVYAEESFSQGTPSENFGENIFNVGSFESDSQHLSALSIDESLQDQIQFSVEENWMTPGWFYFYEGIMWVNDSTSFKDLDGDGWYKLRMDDLWLGTGGWWVFDSDFGYDKNSASGYIEGAWFYVYRDEIYNNQGDLIDVLDNKFIYLEGPAFVYGFSPYRVYNPSFGFNLRLEDLEFIEELPPRIVEGESEDISFRIGSNEYPLGLKIKIYDNSNVFVEEENMDDYLGGLIEYSVSDELEVGIYNLYAQFSGKRETRLINLGSFEVVDASQQIELNILSPSVSGKYYNGKKFSVRLESSGQSTWFNIDRGSNRSYTGEIEMSLDDGYYTIFAYTLDESGEEIERSLSFRVRNNEDNSRRSSTTDNPSYLDSPRLSPNARNLKQSSVLVLEEANEMSGASFESSMETRFWNNQDFLIVLGIFNLFVFFLLVLVYVLRR